MMLTELNQMKVSDVMTKEVLSVNPNTYLKDIAATLKQNSIHHIPVVDENKHVVGIISSSDILLYKYWGTKYSNPSHIAIEERLFESQLASDVMTQHPVTITPDTILETCAEIFKENLFHAIPVVKDSVLVGMISTFDLINTAYGSSTKSI